MSVFNSEAYLEQAVASVLSQTLHELELVAVDGGSTDGSRELLERFALADPRVRVLAGEGHLGIAEAFNLAVSQARSDYVAIAHADDVNLPERLERQTAFLDAHPEVALVGAAVITINVDGGHGPLLRFPAGGGAIRSTLLRHNCVAHPTVMFRRSAVQSVGGYRSDHVEDYELWLRLAERFELANLAEPLLLYRIHPVQASQRWLEQTERWRLVVRDAARARAAGRPDPLAAAGQLTPEVIAVAAVDERELARAVRAELLARAAILAELGSAESDALLAEVTSRPGRPAVRTLASARQLLRAEACLAAARRGPAIEHVLRAFAHDPLHTGARLWSGLVDRLGAARVGAGDHSTGPRTAS